MASTRTRLAFPGLHPRSVSVDLGSHIFNYALTKNCSVGDEITILGSFSETYKFPAAIDYMESGKVKVEGIVNKVFKVEQWAEALEAVRNKSAIKAAIVWD